MSTKRTTSAAGTPPAADADRAEFARLVERLTPAQTTEALRIMRNLERQAISAAKAA